MRLFYLIVLAVMSFAITSSLADNRNLSPYTLQWSPDGQWIARGYTDGIVLVTSLNNPVESIEFKQDGVISNIAWSPDSSRLAASLNGDGHISIWDIPTQSLVKILEGDLAFNGGGTHLAWNPKKEILVSVAREYDGGMQVRFWDTKTYTLMGSGNWVDPLSAKWNHDGDVLGVASIMGGLELYDTFVGEYIPSKAYLPDFAFFDWSPDGTHIAALKYKETHQNTSFIETDSWLTIVDMSTLKEMAQISKPVHSIQIPVLWSPDGQRIAIVDYDQIDVIDAQTGISLGQYASPLFNFNASWSPFGGRLAISTVSDQSLANFDDIQILVPAPSLDLLQSIAVACVPIKPPAALPTTDDLATYIETVQADASIPPACAADLIAVAEALQTEQTTSP
jgi:WD40 repeat protein